jgi:CRP/FNR family cyclic AMP-dependent transcriptional regulator
LAVEVQREWTLERVAGPHGVAVLREDVDLAAGLGGARLAAAERDCVARVVFAERGRWAPRFGPDVIGGLGLLLLDGLIVRHAGGNGRSGAELLGPGDLLRPWDYGHGRSLPVETSLKVVEHARLAVLDYRFAARLAPYPEVAGALVGRGLERARTLAVQLAIAHHPRVDHRILLLFWHLAERWAKVTPGGVHLELSVTHQCLADLVAARRPSVSTGLAHLCRDGLVVPTSSGWLLHGDPPLDLFQEEALRLAGHR